MPSSITILQCLSALENQGALSSSERGIDVEHDRNASNIRSQVEEIHGRQITSGLNVSFNERPLAGFVAQHLLC
jgi:hypothetical protein